MGDGDAGEAAAFCGDAGILGQGFAAEEGEPAAVEGEEGDFRRGFHAREAEALLVEAHGALQVADAEGKHADSWLHFGGSCAVVGGFARMGTPVAIRAGHR